MMIRTRSIREAKPGDLATYRWGSLRKFENGRIFAPSETLLAASKYDGLPWEEYERRYLDEMEAIYRKSPLTPLLQRGDGGICFLSLLQRAEVTLVCYETRPDQCHRRLLAGLLSRIAMAHGRDVELDIR
jgi:uncharacterized protein YeaO (DUF488 family)